MNIKMQRRRFISSIFLIVLLVSMFTFLKFVPSVYAKDLIDSYSEAKYCNDQSLSSYHAASGTSDCGQSFTMLTVDYTLTSAKFYLKKYGSPTGLAYAVLYTHTGTYGTSSKPTGKELARSVGVNVVALTTSYAWYEYTFNDGYVMSANTKYCINFENPSSGLINGTNYINVGGDQGYLTHAGNYFRLTTNVWYANADLETCFYVYGTAAPDVKLPTYSNIGVNTTRASYPCSLQTAFNDNKNVSMAFISHNNTGIWTYNVSVTLVWINTTAVWSNYTLTLNSTVGRVVGWYQICNDTANNFNATMPIQILVTTEPPTYSDIGTTTPIDGQSCTFYTKWTDETGLATTGGFILETNNTGTSANETWTAFATNPDWSNKTKTLNTTAITIQWRLLANDTSDNWNATATQYTTTISNETLIARLTKLVNNKINWTESISTVYLGMMFEKTNMTDLQNAIAASLDWQEVLTWSAMVLKFGVENETKIKWALDNATMVEGLPYVELTPHDLSSYAVKSRGLLYGYYWANKYSYLQTKWNLTTAFNNFASAYNWTGHGFCWYINASYTDSYYDPYEGQDLPRSDVECTQTLACFLVFYEICNVTEALNYAETEWEYLNNNLWCTNSTYGAPHFAYIKVDSTYGMGWVGAGAGSLLQIAAWLKYDSPRVGNISRLMTDITNRYIASNWSSPQWTFRLYNNQSEPLYIYPAITTHHSYDNGERVLEGTVTAWGTLFATCTLLNETEMQNFQSMLNGYSEYPSAWKCLYNTTSDLYDATTGMFRSVSGAEASNLATALMTNLQFFLGITPINTTLTVPLESLMYVHQYNMFDSQLFNMSLTTHKVTLGIRAAGALNFTFNAVTTQMFTSSGLFELTFDNNWNTITNCIKIGELLDRRYLQLSTSLNVGWNNFTTWNDDVGKNLEQIYANLQYNNIFTTIIILYNGTEYRYDYGSEPNASTFVLTTSDELRVYCTSDGEWFHEYDNFYYLKSSPSQALSLSLLVTTFLEFFKSISLLIAATFSTLRLGEMSRTTSLLLGISVVTLKLTQFVRSAIQSITASLTATRLIDITKTTSLLLGISAVTLKLGQFARATSQTLNVGFAVSRIAEFFRSVSQAISTVLNSARLIDLLRSASQTIALTLQSIGEKAGIYVRDAVLTIIVSLQTSRLTEWLKTVTQTISFTLQNARLFEFVRTVSQSIVTVLDGQRTVELLRSASQTITLTLLGIGDKTGIYLRNTALTIATAFQGSRLAEWLKSASQTISMTFGTARLAEFSRVASEAIGLTFGVIGEKLGNYIANVALTITATLQNSRLADWTRQATQTLGLSLTTSRIAEFLAIAVLTITTTFNANRLVDIVRQAEQSLNFLLNGERLIEVSRIVSQNIALTLQTIGEMVGNYFRNALLNVSLTFATLAEIPEATILLALAIAFIVVACVVTYVVAKTQKEAEND